MAGEGRSFTVVGADLLMQKLATLGPKARQMGAQALYQEALVVKQKAFQLCPKDKGHLRNSLWVQRPVFDGNEASVTIHCGGGVAAPYAIAVHEHFSEHSPPSWKQRGGKSFSPTGVASEGNWGRSINWSVPGTGPKFLERPVLEASAKLGELLVKRLDMATMVR